MNCHYVDHIAKEFPVPSKYNREKEQLDYHHHCHPLCRCLRFPSRSWNCNFLKKHWQFKLECSKLFFHCLHKYLGTNLSFSIIFRRNSLIINFEKKKIFELIKAHASKTCNESPVRPVINEFEYKTCILRENFMNLTISKSVFASNPTPSVDRGEVCTTDEIIISQNEQPIFYTLRLRIFVK